NRMRGLLTEFGVVAPLSPEKLRRELRLCLDEEKTHVPLMVRQLVTDELAALDALEQRIADYAAQIAAQVRDKRISAASARHRRRRSAHRCGDGGHRRTAAGISQWSPIRSVARLGATAAQHRRQKSAW